MPYGLPSIRELFRFLISIMNPNDKQNSEEMSHMGIYLLTVALETAADHLPKYASLMSLVKNELCFNLFRVGLCFFFCNSWIKRMVLCLQHRAVIHVSPAHECCDVVCTRMNLLLVE